MQCVFFPVINLTTSILEEKKKKKQTPLKPTIRHTLYALSLMLKLIFRLMLYNFSVNSPFALWLLNPLQYILKFFSQNMSKFKTILKI